MTTWKRLGTYILGPVIAGLAAWALYWATAAPWLTWAHHGADGGDLIAAAMTWGVPHPSGYPTYCLLSRLFALLPLGGVGWDAIARRFTLFSAATAAASTALVCAMAQDLLHSDDIGNDGTIFDAALPVAAILIALAWASGTTLWSQAIITEVYAPWTAMVALCLWLTIRLEHRPSASLVRGCAALGLLLGLGTGLHLTIVLMIPGLVVLLWPRLYPRPRALLSGLAGLALGLGVYAYLPLVALLRPPSEVSPVYWGNPRTWSGFWWTVSGAPYRGYLLGLPLRYLPQRLTAWLGLWRQQYTLPGVLLALVGLADLWQRDRRRTIGHLFIVAYSLLAITYDTVDSYVYLLPAYLVAALWLAAGSCALARHVRPWLSRRWTTALVVALLLILPLWGVASRFAHQDLSADQQARIWVEETLATLPQGALLISGEDAHTFTMDYIQWVEGRRLDLCVIDGELLQYSWYVEQLARRCPDLGVPWEGGRDAPALSVSSLVSAQWGRRPLYLASPRPELAQDWQVEPRGALWLIANPRVSAKD
jgi:hypothetical protein